jgi:RNA polymerase sigma-70 factor, ECF subfamily
MADEASLHELLDRWRQGDQAAATAIYSRYEQRLIELAERKIGRQLQRRVGPESIALTVLDTVLKRLATGAYYVDPDQSLWNLLQVVAGNKISGLAKYHHAGQRDVDKEVLPQQTDSSDGREPPGISVIREPPPEEAAILADELEKIRTRLKPDDFEIVQLQFQGYSNPEIAERLGCARQTVRYKVKRIEETIRKCASDHENQCKYD